MYSARINRLKPTLFVILVDQSGSMAEPTLYQGDIIPKSEAVAAIVNEIITELLHRAKREGNYLDYFQLMVLGYRNDQVVSLLPDVKTPVVFASELARAKVPSIKVHKSRLLPNGHNSISITERKVWVKAESTGNTPMYAALNEACKIVTKWCANPKNRTSFAPTIFNLTDGEASDANDKMLIELASRIMSQSTGDGATQLINIHISSNLESKPIVFPKSEKELPDDHFARLLYRISSNMPPIYNAAISRIKNSDVSATYKGLGYNASMTDVVSMMSIGSISVNIID